LTKDILCIKILLEIKMHNKQFKQLILTVIVLLLAGCTTLKYENAVMINAPDNIVFRVLEDYENYPTIIPEFHSAVKIVSENKTGIGVKFNNISTWGGYKIESTYEVVEYRINENIKLKNLSQYGSAELIVKKNDDTKSEYTLINYTKVPFYMKKRLYESFGNELKIVKQVCEN
jgi:uncharacterized membrane protein